MRVAEGRGGRVRDVAARRRTPATSSSVREEPVHADVLAAEEVALPALRGPRRALERRDVALRHVLHVGVRPEPVAGADDAGSGPRRWSATIFTTMLPSVRSPGP